MDINKVILLQIVAIVSVIIFINVPTARATKRTTIHYNQIHIQDTTLYDISNSERVDPGVPLTARCYSPRDHDASGTRYGETNEGGVVDYIGSDSDLPDSGLYVRRSRHTDEGYCKLGVNIDGDIDDMERSSNEPGASARWKGTVSKEDIIWYDGWDGDELVTKFQGLKGDEHYDEGRHWFGWVLVIIIVIILVVLTGGAILKPLAAALGAKLGPLGAALGAIAILSSIGVALIGFFTGAARYLHCGFKSALWPGADGCRMDRNITGATIALEPSGPGDKVHNIDAATEHVENPQVAADNIITGVKEMNKYYLNEYLIQKGLNGEEINEVIHVVDEGDYADCHIAPDYGYIDGDTTRPLEGSLRVVDSALNESMILPNETYKFTIENTQFADREFEIIAQKLTENTDMDEIMDKMEQEVQLGNLQGPCVSSRTSTPLTHRVLNLATNPTDALSINDVYTPSPMYEGGIQVGYWEEEDKGLYCAEGDETYPRGVAIDSYIIPREVWRDHGADDGANELCRVTSENYANKMVPCGQGTAAPVGFSCGDMGRGHTCPIGAIYDPGTQECKRTVAR